MNLTTLALVKERFVSLDGTNLDALINTLIGEVSDEYETRIGRALDEDTFTEYRDGEGKPELWLRNGPLVSVTSLHSIVWEDDGADNRQESATEIKEYLRLEDGLRADGWKGRGRISLIGSVFTRGQQNYKIIYTAGYTTVPGTLERIATWRVVAEVVGREMAGVNAKDAGDGSLSLITPKQLYDAEERALAPFRAPGV